MPVKIAEKQLPPLISSPAPIPIPDPSLFTSKVMPDGRQIWVSAPLPDRLSIVIPLSGFVYEKGIDPKLSVPEFLAGFVDHLLNPKWPVGLAGKAKFAFANDPDKDPEWRAASLTFGNRDASIHFSRYKHQKLGLSLRLEMNPRKVGPTGFEQLANLLSGWFNLQSIAEAARVTRLDIALDIVGAHITEVIAFQKAQGKRVHYVGSDGLLETVYVNRKLPAFKQKYDEYGPIKPKKRKYPAGKPLLKLYDRVRERASMGADAPFGDAPVTRVEIVKDRFVKTKLQDLLTLPDPFAGTKVGYVVGQSNKMPAVWRRYASMSALYPPEIAASALDVPSHVAKAYAKALRVPQPNLVAPESNWSSWAKGLQATGLEVLCGSAHAS